MSGTGPRRIAIPLKPITQLFRVPAITLGVAFFFVGVVEWLLHDEKYWLILGLALTFVALMIQLSRTRKHRERQT